MFAIIPLLKNMTKNFQATTENGGGVKGRSWVPNCQG